ncbi:uncharacterized protein [Rutidosis leptorrhynchoides]|uniref:uncharacterized protein n=1 Tax=Rutidosis leptorrhynchoides TaxID=125765 RepID=UPI003A9A0E3A
MVSSPTTQCLVFDFVFHLLRRNGFISTTSNQLNFNSVYEEIAWLMVNESVIIQSLFAVTLFDLQPVSVELAPGLGNIFDGIQVVSQRLRQIFKHIWHYIITTYSC